MVHQPAPSPGRLCTPADKNGEGRHDEATHLRGYQIRSAPRAPLPSIKIVNQLGTVVVGIKSPDSLLVPAATVLGAPAAPLGAHTVDHYQCYRAKLQTKRCTENPARRCKKEADCGSDGPCLGKFAKGLQVTVADQFAPTSKRFEVVKPTRLCSPTVKNGEPIQSPGGQLLCYRVKPAAGQPLHTKVVGTIHTTTQIGRDRLDTVAEDELCVPSLEVPAA